MTASRSLEKLVFREYIAQVEEAEVRTQLPDCRAYRDERELDVICTRPVSNKGSPLFSMTANGLLE